MATKARGLCALVFVLPTALALGLPARVAVAEVTRAQVERSIAAGIRFLEERQNRGDGTWAGPPGMTALVTLALLTAGEKPDSPHVRVALEHLSHLGPREQNNTYAVALQTMAFAAADPERFQRQIAENVNWIENTQIRSFRGGRGTFAVGVGSWSYPGEGPIGDNSNTQYALLGLNAGREAGIPVKREVWSLARQYWEQAQQREGGWGYKPGRNQPSTGSMTCAGLASLIITGTRFYQGQENLVGESIHLCGQGEHNAHLIWGMDWLARNFRVNENPGSGQQWKYYYLYGLERAGRLTGQRYFGGHDWYREGAELLVSEQDGLSGGWLRDNSGPLAASSFALLFLAKGRAPVLVNKLRHGPGGDWDNDPDDVRNLVDQVSRDWKNLLTWQVIDPQTATVEDMLQAPIVYFSGHDAPAFGPLAKTNLRDYIEQGGFILADACCGRQEFDKGFRNLIAELFPEREYELHPLPEEHPIWRAKYRLTPEVHPLWGVEHGCRTVIVYSPSDLSCFWNQSEAHPDNPAVIKAQRVGQNIVDYVTGREMPADKLEPRFHELARAKVETPKRGALHIAKLRHAGDWNVAPLAIPNLTTALRDKLGFDVVINHREIFPRDPNLVNFPLLYIHGRAALAFSAEDRAILLRHLEPGGGTIFADAACGSPAFDASFRKFVAELLPDHPLVPIPPEDPLYTREVAYDLTKVQYTKAAGGQKGQAQLEGVKLNGHWAIIYSKYDIGCALEHPQGIECKGYSHDSALQIAANIVIYSTLP